MTPEHKAKMAAGRERTRAAKAAAAVRKAERAAAKEAPIKATLMISPALKEELEKGIGCDVPNDFADAGMGTPSWAIEEWAAKRKEMTIEQAKMILAANQIGIDFSAEKLAEAQRVLNPPKPVLAPGEIDYDKLADLVAARLRPAARAELAGAGDYKSFSSPEEFNRAKAEYERLHPERKTDDRGMPVEAAHPIDPHRVAKGSRMERILKQLTYPPDREGQVAAMVAANMAPSWGEGNQEVGDSPYPPPSEGALVAYMQEYCMSLRPELPKPRLEPKYKLASEKSTGQ